MSGTHIRLGSSTATVEAMHVTADQSGVIDAIRAIPHQVVHVEPAALTPTINIQQPKLDCVFAPKFDPQISVPASEIAITGPSNRIILIAASMPTLAILVDAAVRLFAR